MTKLFLIMEHDEDNVATQWRDVFTTKEAALAFVEAAHKEAWVDAEMDGECPELVALQSTNDETVVTVADQNVDWTAWTITEATLFTGEVK